MAPSYTPRLLQVDADAFYVQVARLADPEGAGRVELLLVGTPLQVDNRMRITRS